MSLKDLLKPHVKAARRRGALWARLLDVVRLLPTAQGRSVLWTRLRHGGEVHQTTADTAEDRYPELFDHLAELMPRPRRVLSFGCSTGEELVSLRRRFPRAEIVGAEINARSRRLAVRRTARDPLTAVVSPDAIRGSFDLIFALAVLQREPHKIAEMQVEDLSTFYPFERFDAAVTSLSRRLDSGGLFCIDSAHYRLEDSSAVRELEPVEESPLATGLLFGPDGRRLRGAKSPTIFRKR